MQEQQFAAGSTIFSEGQPSDHVYVIKQGKVEILKQAPHGSVQLAMLGQGEVIGEMSVFETAEQAPPRSASARAAEDTVLEVMDRQEVAGMVAACPAPLQLIMRTILSRVRNTTQRLSEKETPAVEVECNFTEMLIAPATEFLQEHLQPQTIAVNKLPLEIIGVHEDDTKGKRTSEGLIVLPCQTSPQIVSKRHLIIEVQDKSVFIVDCGSRFGTLVNGKAIGKGKGKYKVPLEKGEFAISLGGKTSDYQLKITCQ
jgi:hypothetical protein